MIANERMNRIIHWITHSRCVSEQLSYTHSERPTTIMCRLLPKYHPTQHENMNMSENINTNINNKNKHCSYEGKSLGNIITFYAHHMSFFVKISMITVGFLRYIYIVVTVSLYSVQTRTHTHTHAIWTNCLFPLLVCSIGCICVN